MMRRRTVLEVNWILVLVTKNSQRRKERTFGKSFLVHPAAIAYHDCYEIKILLSETQNGWPKVFETGGRIEKLAAKIGKPIIDQHVYPNDNSCCLGIDFNTQITLQEFILNKVYPYFVWQAYFDKYRKIPPCGEYSHGGKGFAEYKQDLKDIGRNDPCICGSGKKYKKCCIDK